MVRRCAPLERQTVVGREVYKHLVPLEPEHRLVAALLRCISVVNNAKANSHHTEKMET